MPFFKLIVLAVVIAILVSWIFYLLTLKPNIKINYVSKYNEITKPAHYDPAKNAALYYEKAYQLCQNIPDILENRPTSYPADFNDQELSQLREFIAENKNTLRHFFQGAVKPYFWQPVTPAKKGGLDVEPIVSGGKVALKHLARLASMSAKFEAFDGNHQNAFKILKLLCKAGTHFSGQVNTLLQMVGLAMRKMSLDSAFAILHNEQVPIEYIKEYQAFLEKERQQRDCYELSFSQGEYFFFLDGLQCLFTDNGKRDGRLIPKELVKITKGATNIDGSSGAISLPKAIFIALNHPNRAQTVKLSEHLRDFLNQLKKKTPWELKQQNGSYIDLIAAECQGDYLLSRQSHHYATIFTIVHNFNARFDALITTLALMRFKSQNGSYPETLDQLLKAGFISFIPMDPYSSDPLLYRKASDSFILYSIGPNFNDDGGKYETQMDQDCCDYVYWPLQKNVDF
jgi:hypothetical protein